MDLDLVFVGTAASVPSAGRGLSSMLVRRGGERLLFDCGEGTQRQLMRSTGLGEIDAVFITHLHADHVLGLPGMLKTFGLREREHPLVVAGPPGIRRFFDTMGGVIGRLPYEIDLREVRDDTVWEGEGAVIRAIPTEHGVPSVGWALEEEDRPGRFDVDEATRLGVRPGADFGILQRGGEVTTEDGAVVRSSDVVGEDRLGRLVVYTGDTRACEAVRDASRDATVLVHEATFLNEDADRARATNHSTALEAGLTAAAADVTMLVLTHISTRYIPRMLGDEAATVFANTIVARDFDLIDVPFPERGEPRHIVRGARERSHDSGSETEPAVAMRATCDDEGQLEGG